MMFKLVLGNKNYSSWSMRPWFALKASGIPFEEIVIPIYRPESKAEILKYTPSGKVPVLIDGAVTVWDSLAIIEYAAERFPDAKLWPQNIAQRAHARAISAEMHGGFLPLRRQCGMNMHRPHRAKTLDADALADITRVQAIWLDCRARYGAAGPFLFGAFSAADAMFAPVVSRFVTYAIETPKPVRDYMDNIMALPAWQEWLHAALDEPWRIEAFEDV